MTVRAAEWATDYSCRTLRTMRSSASRGSGIHANGSDSLLISQTARACGIPM